MCHISTLKGLADEIAGLDALPAGAHEVHMLEVAYWSAVVRAERDWIQTLAERLRTGNIEWPPSGRPSSDQPNSDQPNSDPPTSGRPRSGPPTSPATSGRLGLVTDDYRSSRTTAT